MKQSEAKNNTNRRSFLKKGALAAGVATMGAGVLTRGLSTFAQATGESPGPLTAGDAALLRFAAAAELIESDLWQQYRELGGVTQAPQNNYQLALQFLDSDGSQYITSNTLDEMSHAAFLNAYLISKGAEPVVLDEFRTLPSSKATGAEQIGRLTNLMKNTVDTSWYIRYRSQNNPDFGATFQQALSIVNRPLIPRDNADFNDPDHIQAIADSAAFHFGTIEQGGTSLYATLAQKATSPEVLKILISIGGDEIAHFLEWVDFSGNAVQGPPFSFQNSQTPVTDHGLTFPNFNALNDPLFQTNLIFPVPCEFISPDFPPCAVIRPTGDLNSIAADAAAALTADGLFAGQSPAFFHALQTIAQAADAAKRE
jgi:hypothetical protein